MIKTLCLPLKEQSFNTGRQKERGDTELRIIFIQIAVNKHMQEYMTCN